MAQIKIKQNDQWVPAIGGTITVEEPYELPTASTSVLGGVKVDGDTITIDANGVISGSGGSGPNTYIKSASKSGDTLTLTKQDDTTLTYTPDIPTKTSDLTNDSGFITNSALANYATTSALNSGLATKQNTLTAGSNITISGNTISATDTVYSLPTASTSTLGGVKVDNSTITIDANGVISSSGGGAPNNYIKSASVSGNTLTLTKQDDTTVTFTDTDTTYTAGTGIDIDNGTISSTCSTVSGSNDGTNWTALTINGTTKNIPSGGGGGGLDSITAGNKYKSECFNGVGQYVGYYVGPFGHWEGGIGNPTYTQFNTAAFKSYFVHIEGDHKQNSYWLMNDDENNCFDAFHWEGLSENDSLNPYYGNLKGAHWEGYSRYANLCGCIDSYTTGQGAHIEGYKAGSSSNDRLYINVSEGAHIEGFHSMGSYQEIKAGVGYHVEGYNTVSGCPNYLKRGVHIQGSYNMHDSFGFFLDIVGNGTGNRSNAEATDWSGNKYISGKIYVGCDNYTTSDSGPVIEGCGGVALAPIPECPVSNDGTYKLQCVVLDGVPTYSWVSD